METDKTPGTDGLQAEFYKVFRILEILTLKLLILHTIKVNCQSPEKGCGTSFCQVLETINITKLRLQNSN